MTAVPEWGAAIPIMEKLLEVLDGLINSHSWP
jgi:hypothetical protein